VKLSQAIRKYVAMKQVMGITFHQGKKVLVKLQSHVGDVPLRSVTEWQVLAFLERSVLSDVTWLLRHRTLTAFFEYWLLRGDVSALPMPPPRQPGTTRTFVPYIYSISEVRELLRQAALKRRARRSNEFSALTLHTLLLFLYGSGARIHEAVFLETSDVDLRHGTVTFRHNGNRVRTVPLGRHLWDNLRKYDDSILSATGIRKNFFIGEKGEKIRQVALTLCFQRLRRKAGISRSDGFSRQPRVQDLRRTFGVHCLQAWLRRGADLRTMLPVLGAYLGHVSLISTEAYLSVTPERFTKQLSYLSPPPASALNSALHKT
jgi:integrase/recombinase XerD